MRLITLLLSTLPIAIGTQSILAQVNVTLHIEQKLGDEPFSYEQVAHAEMGYAFEVTRLQYYLSGFELVHDEGITPLKDVYLLIDPAIDTEFELGNVDLDHVNQIRFHIGVDVDHNHLDPATYPSDHPLALHDPSMHWGWAGGYRFIAFEGLAGPTEDSMDNNFQLHTTGDQNYFPVTIDVDPIVEEDEIAIHLIADYTRLLEGIDVSPGMINHGGSGAAKKLAQNLRDFVYTPVITGIHDEVDHDAFHIAPNPVYDYATVYYNFKNERNVLLEIFDVVGNTMHAETLEDASGAYSIPVHWTPGVYYARLRSGSRVIGYEKLIVK